MTDKELQQIATAHDLFCELSPHSKDIAINVLRLLLVEETRPFLTAYSPDINRREQKLNDK